MKKLLILLFQIFVFLIAKEGFYINPIISGAHPDPSICRAGDDYYIVNSSFEYFPGIPIHHSTDLVLWKLIGHGLHRKEQCKDAVNLMDVQSDGGIHAPTLRYHDSTFYLITTNVYQPPNGKDPTQFVNFILTAKNPSGPWSNPIVIKNAPGIDPDIFFDAASPQRPLHAIRMSQWADGCAQRNQLSSFVFECVCGCCRSTTWHM